jgi:polyhydroxyalkanoate synthesis regulator phasin
MADQDASKDPFQKYLDAGIAFTNLTRARAEKLVSELAQSGEFRGDARAKVDELIERSRKSQEALFAQVRHEVDRQLEHLGITNLEDLAKQVASLIGRTADAGRAATSGRAATKKGGPKKRAPAKKAGATKAAAKKAAAKKSPARTSAAKKAAKKKSAAKAAKKSPSTGHAAPGTRG